MTRHVLLDRVQQSAIMALSPCGIVVPSTHRFPMLSSASCSPADSITNTAMRDGVQLKPLKLSLQGFTGIFAAFGRDSLELDLQTIPEGAALVALVGPNGAGKSTILDSLHPYRVMP